MEGELVLILEDSEVALKAGDVVVQRGTNHAWENRAQRVARAAFFHIDAKFSPELLNALPAPLELMR
jgi:quercetin dioxygenase-like cupin family protein